MKVISGVTIQQFRSLKELRLDDFGDFTVFAGLNNAGKSNILKALNLFFNDEVEPSVPLDLHKDLTKAKNYRRKNVKISVEFQLPENFNFRKKLEPVDSLLGREFTITKEWGWENRVPVYYVNNDQLKPEDSEKVQSFLKLINYRYIPNRVLPLDVVRSEHKRLRTVLIKRLHRKAKDIKTTLSDFNDAAARLVGDLSENICRVSDDVEQVALLTPRSIADMVFEFGYRLKQGGFEFDDIVQGSGLQSYLMFETLYLIDKDYWQAFGWRQATVWGVEEAESSLHYTLEAQTALLLSRISQVANSRLQILATTHSEMMMQYCTLGYFVEKRDNKTNATSYASRELCQVCSDAGTSKWVHPLLHYPLDKILFVEGKYDYDFIVEALRLMKSSDGLRVLYLGKIEEEMQGGTEAPKYLINYKTVIRNRRQDAKIYYLVDWEAKGKLVELQKKMKGITTFMYGAWNQLLANPKLGGQFPGIERFFSDRIIDEAKERGAEIGTLDGGRYTINNKDYGEFKRIANQIVKEGINAKDIVFVKDTLREIRSALLA